jgi:hypothetical protein
MFFKENYFFLNKFHSDLHDANWKITKHKDFFKLIIYDFGYIIDNNYHNTFKNVVYYIDIRDYINMAKILYKFSNNNSKNEEHFVNNFNNYMLNNEKYNTLIINIYNYLYENQVKLENFLFELFIAMILTKKKFDKYIFPKIEDSNYNLIIKLNIMYINFCKYYNIFDNMIECLTNYYIDNNYYEINYYYSDNYLDNFINNNLNNIHTTSYDI